MVSSLQPIGYTGRLGCKGRNRIGTTRVPSDLSATLQRDKCPVPETAAIVISISMKVMPGAVVRLKEEYEDSRFTCGVGPGVESCGSLTASLASGVDPIPGVLQERIPSTNLAERQRTLPEISRIDPDKIPDAP